MITLYAFLFVNVTKYQLSEETFEISILTNLLRTQYIYIYIYMNEKPACVCVTQ